MGLKRRIETLKEWACSQAHDCCDCRYAIHGVWNNDVEEYDDWCPFDNVIKAAGDRASEVVDQSKERRVIL